MWPASTIPIGRNRCSAKRRDVRSGGSASTVDSPNSLQIGLDQKSRLFLRRFFITVLGIAFVAFALAPQAPLRSFATMMLVAGTLDSVFAALRRDRLDAPSFNYWDGSAGFLALSCLARLLT